MPLLARILLAFAAERVVVAALSMCTIISLRVRWRSEQRWFSPHLQLTHVLAALLNDLFGVQVRGGCMCAGPIVQAEMGISNSAAVALEHMMLQVVSMFIMVYEHRPDIHDQGYELLRPGVVRLCLHYCSR